MRSQEETRRRIKAARELAGISVGELAERINQSGLGERSLRALEGKGGRAIRPMDLHAIAEATDLPYGFFTEDLRAVFATEHDRISEIEDRLRRLEAEREMQAPPGGLGHHAEGSQPSAGRRPQNGHQAEEGPQRGAGR